MAVFGFALIFSRLAWYRCGIRLRCGCIRLRPNFFTPGLVSLRYSALRYFSGVFQVVVAEPVHGGREIGLWREIICDFDLLHFTLQVICAPPRRTTPMGLLSFPSAESVFPPRKQNSNAVRDTLQKRTSKETLRQYKGNSSRSVLLRASSFPSCGCFNFRWHRSLVRASLNLSLGCLVLWVGPP